jgi:hypothetical protein
MDRQRDEYIVQLRKVGEELVKVYPLLLDWISFTLP